MSIISEPINRPAAPNALLARSILDPSTPNVLPGETIVDPSVPNSLTALAENDPAAPNSPTPEAIINPGLPKVVTALAENDPSTPNVLPGETIVDPSTPNAVTALSENDPSAANTIPSEPEVDPAAPNTLPSLPAAGFPRTIEPLVDMHFFDDTYEQFGNPIAFDDLFDYSRNSDASFFNRRLGRTGKFEFFLDTDVVGDVTNDVTFSEDFDQWAVVGSISVKPNQTIAPDGQRTADLITLGLGSSDRLNSNSLTPANNTQIFITCYFKKGTFNLATIGFFSDETTTVRSNIDLTTGVMTGVSGTSHIAHQGTTWEGNGWWRTWILLDSKSTWTNAVVQIARKQGDGLENYFVWGAMVSLDETYIQPYVKTLDIPVTETFVEKLRLEFDPVTGENLGALIEGPSTNLFLRSEEFDNASWIKTDAVITANDSEAPDETTSMDKFAAGSTATIVPILEQTITSVAAQTYTSIFYVKKSEAAFIQILYSAGHVANDPRANFDLINGVLGTVDADITAKITDVGNGIFRITSTVIAVGTSLKTIPALMKSATDARFLSQAWSAGDGVNLWGGQCEEQSFGSSYIRTEGAIKSRAGDFLTIPYEGNIQPPDRILTISSINSYLSTPTVTSTVWANNGTAQFAIRTTSGTIRTIRNGIIDSSQGTVIPSLEYQTSVTWDGSAAGITYQNDEQFALDELHPNDASTLLYIGNYFGGDFLNGHLKKLTSYDENLTAQEVALL